MKSTLVTGSAGFIGFHLCKRLLESGEGVVGLDNFNDYYDTKLKEKRTSLLQKYKNFKLYRGSITNPELLDVIFTENSVEKVCNLAAQAGVRYSITNPHAYIDSNIVGFTTLLESIKKNGVKVLVYASSSSVYGGNDKLPFSVGDDVSKPLSLYGATKRANELIAHSYHSLFGLKCTGLRFFTVYGPWGRPDMALFLFTKAIVSGKPITVFNNGDMKRDFTYVDDIIDGIVSSLERQYEYEIFNLGNSNQVELEHMISCVEKELGREAIRDYYPMQPGDVKSTFADIDKSTKLLGFSPKVTIEEGIHNFIKWYKEYYSC